MYRGSSNLANHLSTCQYHRHSPSDHQGAFHGQPAAKCCWVLVPIGIGTGTPMLTLMEACGLAVTAYGFLETLRVPPGEYLLQGAAGSTLGRQLVALAKERGVKTINAVRRKEQVQELLDMGWGLPFQIVLSAKAITTS